MARVPFGEYCYIPSDVFTSTEFQALLTNETLTISYWEVPTGAFDVSAGYYIQIDTLDDDEQDLLLEMGLLDFRSVLQSVQGAYSPYANP